MRGATFCSGIGAPEMAASWVDWQFASEIEPFPRAVLRERFGYREVGHTDWQAGDPLLWGDMASVTADLWPRHGLQLPDLIVAGTPCQSFSAAGQRKGVADDRGNLTLKFVRIVHDIAATRHDGRLIVLWENVPGVLNDQSNAFGCFLGALVGADGPLLPCARPPRGKSTDHWNWNAGRRWRDPFHSPKWPGAGLVAGPVARAGWRVFNAQHFGVAQRRRRVFLVVDFGDWIDPAEILFERKGSQRHPAPGGKAGQVAAALTANGVSGGGGADDNAAQAEHLIAGHHGDIAGTMMAKWSKGNGGPAGDETQNLVAFDTMQITSATNGSNPQPGDPCRPLAAQGHPPLINAPVVRRLTPVECARLQGFPDDHCQITFKGKLAADSHVYKAYGNSMAAPNVRWILDRLRQAVKTAETRGANSAPGQRVKALG